MCVCLHVCLCVCDRAHSMNRRAATYLTVNEGNYLGEGRGVGGFLTPVNVVNDVIVYVCFTVSVLVCDCCM